MGWDKWPYVAQTLTEAMDPDPERAQELVRLVVSGCNERLQRAMTLLEPTDPVRRVDHVNPYDHFTTFCRDLRRIPAFNAICEACDARRMAGCMAEPEGDRSEGLRVKRYVCDHGLIDYSCPVRANNRVVAVSLSGQFLPQRDEETIRGIHDHAMSVEGVDATPNSEQVRLLVEAVPTEEEYVRSHRQWCAQNGVHYPVPGDHPPDIEAMLLFQHEVEQLEAIAQRQFDLQKHRKEAELLDTVGEPLIRALPEQVAPTSVASPRDLVRPRLTEALQRLCGACALKWAIVFVSPRQLLSVPAAATLLEPFGWYGLADESARHIQHFNWRKAQASTLVPKGEELQPESRPWEAGIQGPFRRGLKGATESLRKASYYSPLSVSHAYRAICVFGPFRDAESIDLGREAGFFGEVARTAMLHTLSSIQGLDFDEDTRKWTEVGAMLVHLSRRSIQPVRGAQEVLRGHFQGRQGYTTERARAALSALETATDIVEGEAAEPFEVLVAPVEDRYVWDECDVAEIIELVVDTYRPLAQEEKQSQIAILPGLGRLPRLECDRKQVAIALGHLLDNAVKYGHHEKEIRIGARQSQRFIEISVDDFGQGIPNHDLDHIWDFGYQGERSTRAKGEEGDGIGLFHVQTIARVHGGSALVHISQRPQREWSQKLEGYRVTFTLRLPIKRPERR